MSDEISKVITAAIKANAAALEAELADALRLSIAESRTILVAHPDQRVDPFYAAGREVRRSAVVPMGTVYEVDRSAFDVLPAEYEP